MEPIGSSGSAHKTPSKVAVEYTDPSGVFQFIEPKLRAALPLRNLNWQSPSRPTRSIGTLYVDLVPSEQDEVQPAQRTVSSPGLPGQMPGSTNELRLPSSSQGPKKERRHQIPGLRQTPYLKLYILRCDDSEHYKSTARSLIREWVKAHAPQSQKRVSANSAENHDAFEWMIIHVVIPDGQDDFVWPSKSSSSVLEKVRSDFNSSAKPVQDRVAQVLSEGWHGGHRKAKDSKGSSDEAEPFRQDSSRAWEDVVSKLKTLILSSFDLRVRQYEEDIKQRVAQRSLPGWNFCTFFVLKEGLARGFESVGLLEDALVGYDELSVELNSALHDEAEKEAAGEATSLLRDHTKELLDYAEWASSPAREAQDEQASVSELTPLLEMDTTPFRERILANDVSSFEFRSYVFARQFHILSRMAASAQIDQPDGKRTESLLNPMILAEICGRAMSFIASVSRTIRQDLRHSCAAEAEAAVSNRDLTLAVANNVVASWILVSVNELISATGRIFQPGHEQPQHDDSTAAASDRELQERPLTYISQSPSPADQKLRISRVLQEEFDCAILLSEDPTSSQAASSKLSNGIFAPLLAQRAQLFMLARRALSTLGRSLGWTTGWANKNKICCVLENIPLEDEPKQSNLSGSRASGERLLRSSSWVSRALVTDKALKDAFYDAYEVITQHSLKSFQLAGHRRSAQAATADLGLSYCYLDKSENAASYFHHLVATYESNQWLGIEATVLELSSLCLKKQDRVENSVQLYLRAVARAIAFRQVNSLSSHTSGFSLQGVLDGGQTGFQEVVEASQASSLAIKAHLKEFFSDIEVDSHIRHDPHRDGFLLGLSLFSHLPGELTGTQVQLEVVGLEENQNRTIKLQAEKPVNIVPGRNSLTLTSEVLATGQFNAEALTLQVSQIVFEHKFSPSKVGPSSPIDPAPDASTSEAVPRIFVWPPRQAFKVEAQGDSHIDLEQPKAILLELNAGRNEVEEGSIAVKAGSAGLRLHTAEASLAHGGGEIHASGTGTIAFSALPAQSRLVVKVPIKLDVDLREIAFKSDVTYKTSNGAFTRIDNHTVPIVLPLGVNVQDIFKEKSLISKFSISCSTTMPLSVLSCELRSSPDYTVSTPYMDYGNLTIFPQQPLSMVYNIRHAKEDGNRAELQRKLRLHIDYNRLDDEIRAAVRDAFVTDLARSDFEAYANVLAAHLCRALGIRAAATDLERVGLLREVNLPTFANAAWDAVLPAAPPQTQAALGAWLQAWHAQHPTVALPAATATAAAGGAGRHRITIPVDVPSTPYLQTAALRLLAPPPLAVGAAVPAELTFRFTRAWAAAGGGGPPAIPDTADAEAADDAAEAPVAFAYELDAPPDAWLVAGRRRGRFAARAGATVTARVALVPQRAGQLLLPGVDVQRALPASASASAPSAAGAPDADAEAAREACQVDCVSQGRAVLVLPRRRAVGVAVEAAAAEGGSWRAVLTEEARA